MRAVSLARCALGALAISFTLGLEPSASATSCSGFNLSDNNLGLSGSVGCVTVSNSGPNQVTVTITMNAGFSIKLNGGDVAFNGLSGLTLSDASTVSIESGLFKGAFTKLRDDQNIDGFGKFAFDYPNIKGQPGGIVSADVISFTLTASGLTASQFTSFAIHFCTASGTNCGPMTGFAQSGPPLTTPEPGAMLLLGTGLLALASLRRTSAIIKRVRRDRGPKLLLANSKCNTEEVSPGLDRNRHELLLEQENTGSDFSVTRSSAQHDQIRTILIELRDEGP